MDDPFVRGMDAPDLDFAGEFLTSWLPFLTKDLCDRCSETLTSRVRSLRSGPPPAESLPEPSGCDSPDQDPRPEPASPKVWMSWADMAQEEDELEEGAEEGEGEGEKKKVELPREKREWIRFNNVKRKKDFICLESLKKGGKIVNTLEGLELHTGVFSAAEQKRIVDAVYELQEKGRKSELGERTYSEPEKWMRGKGRVTIQFGCCYNYALDKDGNPPGILRNVASDPIPSLFKVIIRRLVRWHVLPPSCVPDSCIVNIYEPGDCIPSHIDSHDFVRPFCTVSFLSECNILFGININSTGPGEFSGSTAIPLPVGSVLVFNGNGADVAKHCVPAVPSKRISITFRKMDQSKQPFDFKPDPALQNIQLLQYDPVARENQQQNNSKQPEGANKSFKKGKKPRRMPAGDTQHHPYEPKTPIIMRPRQVIDARSATSSNSTTGRSRDSTGRSFESKPRADPQDVRLLGDDGRRPSEQDRVSEEDGHLAIGLEPGGRTVGLEQKQIIVSLNLEREEEPVPLGRRTSYRDQRSQIRAQPQNHGRRRVRVIFPDD
ncbi:RNA demethylase ALKBH5 [Iris pallida]|uniref:RNA demethylase ALKBH5 n=1 Tax=Iris pallida TaxID=29817 RepID=A0AAX6EE72_IRIPA|nr:RNA demethylase ALKBH5 [Iris pallida]